MFGNKELERLYIYLFDSHSRNHHGRHVKRFCSVLLRLKNIFYFRKYIISTYFPPHLTSLHCEIQFAKILMDALSFSQKTLKVFR